MRTRRGGLSYPPLLPLSTMCSNKALSERSSFNTLTPRPNRNRNNKMPSSQQQFVIRKRHKTLSLLSSSSSDTTTTTVGGSELLEILPDDLLLSILAKLSSSSNSPSDFIRVLLTCKRLNTLGLHSMVLSKASQKTFSVKARSWSESSHRFLKRCADAGNIEACYTLGMIRFYCLEHRESGRSLISKAAMRCHAPALYSLAVLQFNGSGASKDDKDLRGGVALCARAAFLGHVDALRELGHCLQDGYGVKQNVMEGRRFLVQANARELASVCNSLHARTNITWSIVPNQNPNLNPRVQYAAGCPLLSDYGCNVPAQEPHLANRFMIEWFSNRGGSAGPNRRLCSHLGCGRPETRKREFRRCSVCGVVNYCSRACQALDWKSRHKVECAPVERWIDDDDGEDGGEVAVVDS
ncbi:hypothetical protein HN51_058175 [Arachis hypogaea]|uniref:MYND-type domain-containing protein n=1 Tax=Arachis hypogaea TaxID=3818 RepID=A0A444WZR4_ARAHY|nr:F-box protein At1g67340 [Arachis ipaensis]XP_025683966.1 F-box protein At1g67340 [Arachis hypogaea]QHN81373.1 F-box protein [Arachis hypogaea]RYQ82947.1 hypothetical protein Ahy_B10g101545 [Arachis hypogaea]